MYGKFQVQPKNLSRIDLEHPSQGIYENAE